MPNSLFNRFLAFKTTQLISNYNYQSAFGQEAQPLIPIYYNVYRKDISPQWQEGWNFTRDYLVKMQTIAHKRGAEFMVVSLGSLLFMSQRRLKNFKKNITWLTLPSGILSSQRG